MLTSHRVFLHTTYTRRTRDLHTTYTRRTDDVHTTYTRPTHARPLDKLLRRFSGKRQTRSRATANGAVGADRIRSTTNQPQRTNHARSSTEIPLTLTRRQSSETRQSKSLVRVPRRVMRRAPRGYPDFFFPGLPRRRAAPCPPSPSLKDAGPQEQHQGDIAARSQPRVPA